MKKKMISAVLAAVMTFSLAACGTSPYEKLAGSWDCPDPVSEEDWKEDLENLGFFEDEIALADLSALSFVRTMTFTSDKTYSYILNEERSVANVTSALQELFGVLYENRVSMESYYGAFDDSASAEEFIDAYAAGMFEMESGEEMLSGMAEYVYSFYSIEEEEGEYKADSKQIGFKKSGDSDYEYADYSLKNGVLTMGFSNGTVDFTKE